MEQKNLFPKDFLWGASTSSHQVEGGNINDWSKWELENAKELAETAQKRLNWLPDWETVRHKATEPNNYVSGSGVEHYKRYKTDFDIIEELNLNAFRFGIEWARLEPEEGKWDEGVVDHYREYIAELNKRGIEPILNIWHYTLPTWFAAKGGFKRRKNLVHWRRFVQKIADEYGNMVHYIITINEPNVYVTFAYLIGMYPPQEKNLLNAMRVYWHNVLAHKQAYRILKTRHKNIQIGVAMQLANIQAKRPHNLIDTTTTKVMRYFWNWWFIRRIRKYQDFVGINYYFSDYYKGFWRDNPKFPLNDLGWYMEPEGLYPLLLRAWRHYGKPIIVSENGTADHKDESRRWWIEQTIIAMERAISEGVQVKGYLHWSLLDNFEWAAGWWPKFGLVAVDRENGMRRTIRPSAKWFGDWLKHR